MASARIEFGYLLPTRGVILSRQRPIKSEGLFDLAERAEGLGYSSLWVGDSIIAKPRLEVFTFLGALAMRARQAKLGTSVLLSGLRNPVLLAHACATLDIISEGRFILGVGVGRGGPAFEQESSACGVPFKQKPGRMEEGLELMRLLWTKDNVTYAGRYFQVQDLTLEPKPFLPEGPPIWVSSNLVERGLKRVAKHGAAWITNAHTPQLFQECRAKILAYGNELGRDLSGMTNSLYLTMHVNADAARAREEGKNFLEGYYHKSIVDLQKDLVILLGDPEDCLRRLQEYLDLGVTSITVRFAATDQVAQMEFFAKEALTKFS